MEFVFSFLFVVFLFSSWFVAYSYAYYLFQNIKTTLARLYNWCVIMIMHGLKETCKNTSRLRAYSLQCSFISRCVFYVFVRRDLLFDLFLYRDRSAETWEVTFFDFSTGGILKYNTLSSNSIWPRLRFYLLLGFSIFVVLFSVRKISIVVGLIISLVSWLDFGNLSDAFWKFVSLDLINCHSYFY